MKPTVWLARMDDLPPHDKRVGHYTGWLSADEIARQSRYQYPQARHRFLIARVLLRGVLGKTLGCSPESLVFATGTNGKPLLPGNASVHFNLSHSGQWIGLAIGADAEVGLDLEHPRRPRNYLELARHYFHPDEYALLASLPEPARRHRFYQFWTLKEAFFKARGSGITEGLGRINFAGFPRDAGARIDSAIDDGCPRRFYCARDPLACGDEIYLALACAGAGAGTLAPEIIRWTLWRSELLPNFAHGPLDGGN